MSICLATFSDSKVDPNRYNYENPVPEGSDRTLDRNAWSEQQAPLVNANALQLGRVLGGRYQLLEVLGEGGMSAVFLSRHKELDQLVAIKVLRFDRSAGGDSLRRFLQEAKATFQLNHPNLIRLLDFSSAEEDLPYLVMEYVPGKTLGELLKEKGRLEVKEVVEIFCQVCDGLAYAHARGIVHRDLKPSNIMLATEADGTRIAKIVDFGIAKMTHSDNEQHLTKTGEIFGSPFYMSPEQCRGLSPDHRSDLYSIGCAMFECLSGSVPYCGENSMRTLFMHIEEPIPTLKLPRYKSFATARALEEITEQLLQKDPDNRFQSATEVKKSLLASLERSDQPRSESTEVIQKPPSKPSSIMVPPNEVPGGFKLSKKLVGALSAGILLLSVIIGGSAYSLFSLKQVSSSNAGAPALATVASSGADSQHDKASIQSDPAFVALQREAQKLKEDLQKERNVERAQSKKDSDAAAKAEKMQKALRDKSTQDKLEKQKKLADKQKREAREQDEIRQAHAKLSDKIRAELANVQELRSAKDTAGAEEICARAVQETGGLEQNNPVVRSAYFTYLTLLMARPEKTKPYPYVLEIARKTFQLMSLKPAMNVQQQSVVYGALGQGLNKTNNAADAVTYFMKAAECSAAEQTESGDIHAAEWASAAAHAMSHSGQKREAESLCQKLERRAIDQNKPPLALFVIQTAEASIYSEDNQMRPAHETFGRALRVMKQFHLESHKREYDRFAELSRKLNSPIR